MTSWEIHILQPLPYSADNLILFYLKVKFNLLLCKEQTN